MAVKHLESAVGLYLKRVCCDHNVTDVVKVCIRTFTRLFKGRIYFTKNA